MADRKESNLDTDSLDGPDTDCIQLTASSGRGRISPDNHRMTAPPLPHPALAQVAAFDDLDNLSNNLSDLSFTSKDSGIGSFVSSGSAGRQEPVRQVEPGNDSTSLERKHIADLIRYGHRKLGYSEQEVVEVIKQRGTAITRNQLMEGLTQLGERSAHREVKGTSWNADRTDDNRAESSNQETNKSEGTIAQTTDNNLRTIVIDGSNVAMAHGNNVEYSCRGIKIVADYFKERGHEKIIVFVPHDKFKSEKVKDQHILKDLRKQNIIVKTPSKKLEKKITPYDDRFILQIATKEDGIVVSNDSFKDLLREGKQYQDTITKRVLPYTFQRNNFIPAEDPLGRRGPPLDQFLRRRPLEVENNTCPYGRKCTYGSKCKYNHPERDPLGTSLSSNSDEGFSSSWSISSSENQRRHSSLSRVRSAAESGPVSAPLISPNTSPNSHEFHSLPENQRSNRTNVSAHSQSAGSSSTYQQTQPTSIHTILTRPHSLPATVRNNQPPSTSVAESTNTQPTEPTQPTDNTNLQTGENNSDIDLINPTPERQALQGTLVTTFRPSLVLKLLNENPGISAQNEILPLLISHLMLNSK